VPDQLADWFIADFDGPCGWGDWVKPGDTVRLIEAPVGWEHKECFDRFMAERTNR
jgi:hypothetical protein